MRKFLLLLVFLAACGAANGGIAATVNGVDIAVADVQAMRLAASEDVATIDKATFATDLTDAIIDAAIVGAANSEFSIVPTDGDIQGKVDELTQQIETSQGVTVAEFFGTQGLPVERLDVIARQQLIRDGLTDEFSTQAEQATDAEAETLLNADRMGRTTACVRHILVATEEEANAALARIEGGEAFEAVAIDVSTDGSAPSGGDLGCEALGLYVPEFAEAAFNSEVGEVAGPVESQFGFHLILVESTEEPTLDQLKTEINLGRVRDLVNAWIVDKVETAEVTVDPQFGTWVLDPAPQVNPPDTAPPAVN